MGVLDLERAVWPSNSTIAGADLDVLARRRLWQVGRDFKHGTGHGIGSFMCVHEGPQGISRANRVKLEPGMVVSDEPGYYEDGEFGIRIENDIMVIQHPKYDNSLTFDNLSLTPYCRELIDKSILSQDEIDYIDNFHKKCFEKVSPFLKDHSLGLDYLTRQCKPL